MDLTAKLEELDAVCNGDYWIVKCPVCGHKEAFIYLDDVEKHKKKPDFQIPIRCNRLNKCGKISYIEEIKVDEIPKMSDEDVIGISKKGIEKINNLAYFSANLKGFDFDWRGISNKTLKDNGVIYLKKELVPFMKSCGKEAFADKFYKKKCYRQRDLIFPIKDYDENVERLLLRSTKTLDKKSKKEIGMRLIKKSSEVWNRKDLINQEMDYIFVCEGVPDALSVKEIEQNIGVVALPGVRKYKQIIKEIEANPCAKEKTYVLCFDNDEAGQKSLEKLKVKLKELKINYIIFNLYNFKDMNDFLLGNKELFKQTVEGIINPTQNSSVKFRFKTKPIQKTSEVKTKFRFKRKIDLKENNP